MEKLFKLLPVLVLVSIVVAWSFPALALGVRFDWWGFEVALSLLAGAALTAAMILAVTGVTLLSAIKRRDQPATHRAILVVLILAAPVGMVFHFGLKGSQAPVLYDVSTDWAAPPPVAALSGARPDTANPLQTAETNQALQADHYPDLQPLVLATDVKGALDDAQRVAEAFGWNVQSVNAQAGILEATDMTFWFGFIDDVVVRVRPNPKGGVTVDIRSVSRVGKSDLGKNAERIRAFMAAMSS